MSAPTAPTAPPPPDAGGSAPDGGTDPRLIRHRPGIGGAVQDVGRRIGQGDLGNLPVMLGLVAVVIYFQWQNDRFLSASNLTNLTLQIAAVATISVGVVLVLLLGEIDLSVGALSGFAAGVMAVLNTRHDVGAVFAILGALAVGAAVGALNGFWVTKFRVPAFLVTLAGLLVWQGALLRVLGPQGSINLTDPGIVDVANTFFGDTVTWVVAWVTIGALVLSRVVGRRRRIRAELPVDPAWRSIVWVGLLSAFVIGAALVFDADRGLPLAVCICVGIVVVVDLVLRRTRFGRHVFAVGGNMEAARRAGIRVDGVRFMVFVLASTLAAMGGVLAASRSLSVSQGSGGNDVLLYAIAGAVIGGTSLFGGRGSAWSALLGALVIGSIINGMTLLSSNSDMRFIVTGVVLLAAATVDAVSRRGRASAGRA
jgi:D-xylose transport system permease protein